MEFLSVFASVDKDQDLVIHEADLDFYAAEMKYEKAFTQKWLRLFDLNKDGKITFGEFCETLGLDEKIYEEKLRDVRKNIALRQQQPQEQQQQQANADRANRRVNRLPRPQPRPAVQKPVQQEVKENVEPQAAKKSQIPQKVQVVEKQVEPTPPEQNVVEEDIVRPQATQKIQAGVPSHNAAPEEVEIELKEDDLSAVQVEFSDMDAKELDAAKALLAKLCSESRAAGSSESAGDFDKRMSRELDKQLGKSWQCQSDPGLSHKEVSYQEGSMAVLVSKQQPQLRVMLWRPQPAGGMCCCS